MVQCTRHSELKASRGATRHEPHSDHIFKEVVTPSPDESQNLANLAVTDTDSFVAGLKIGLNIEITWEI